MKIFIKIFFFFFFKILKKNLNAHFLLCMLPLHAIATDREPCLIRFSAGAVWGAGTFTCTVYCLSGEKEFTRPKEAGFQDTARMNSGRRH